MTTQPSPTIDVLIPARNEEAALPLVLQEISRDLVRTIVVVDNGSTDRTAEAARAAGARVVDCPVAGYGRACLAGLAAMAEDPPDVVVFLDGDRSDHPDHMSDLVAPILADEADMVLGSRTRGVAEKGSLTITQRFGNWLATRLMRLFWRADYSDLGPFRAIGWHALQRLQMADTNFGWTIEMQIKALGHGLRTSEIPVRYRARIGQSKISGTLSGCVRAGTKILYTIFKYRFLEPVKAVPART
ncbi:glycosyltransferase [Acanthopleuribacter pedis]|uniref:Glycosyltransferase family 2 protein n=1 Tax=Acanthopleuribacter pedis TaxID=442870 RepID=A0A8J7QJH7_9BACT|nr:glycosyltransferase family 2 protein [Acanthopleuribacter pedis]